MLGNPLSPFDALAGPAYTLNVTGNEFLFQAGARVYDDDGKVLAPVDVVLFSDSRRPSSKHRLLEIYTCRTVPTMALHRGRRDLLEAHLAPRSRSAAADLHACRE